MLYLAAASMQPRVAATNRARSFPQTLSKSCISRPFTSLLTILQLPRCQCSCCCRPMQRVLDLQQHASPQQPTCLGHWQRHEHVPRTHAGRKEPAVVLLQSDAEGPATYSGSFNKKDLAAWVEKTAAPAIVTLDQ